MQRQKRHWVLLHPIPPPTAQEHTFPAHVRGTPSKVFTSKWFGLSSCLKMEESCFNSLNPVQCCGKSIERGRKEGYLVKADIAPPLAAPSHTLRWLVVITVDNYFTSIAACVWTLGVLHYRGNSNASIHFRRSFCDAPQLFMIQLSSIRSTSVTPWRFMKWGLSQRTAHWEGMEGGAKLLCHVKENKDLKWHLLQHLWEAWGRLEVLWRCLYIPWEEEEARKGPDPAVPCGSNVPGRAWIIWWP